MKLVETLEGESADSDLTGDGKVDHIQRFSLSRDYRKVVDTLLRKEGVDFQ